MALIKEKGVHSHLSRMNQSKNTVQDSKQTAD